MSAADTPLLLILMLELMGSAGSLLQLQHSYYLSWKCWSRSDLFQHVWLMVVKVAPLQ